ELHRTSTELHELESQISELKTMQTYQKNEQQPVYGYVGIGIALAAIAISIISFRRQ
ncbi:MAG: hypothetical protein GWN40_11505, partial [Nitrosopumilaceae archaeon]|nr:hypothetical protein [Nitrosopumilaceae archaeon]